MAHKSMLFENLNEKMVTREIWQTLHQFYSRLIHLVNFKYEFLLYKLVRKNYLTGEELEDATGISRQRVHQIVEEFEQKELSRQNEQQ